MALFTSSSPLYLHILDVLFSFADFRIAFDKRKSRATVPPILWVINETFICARSLESSLDVLVTSASPLSDMRCFFLLGLCSESSIGFTVVNPPLA
jgi:hypothetical protein